MSNNKQQTAVEYLVEQLFPKALSAEQYYHIEQAKSMHKVEIVNAVDGFPIHARHMDGEEYYNETFGGNNEQD